MDKLTIILLVFIVSLGLGIFMVCSSKSHFGGGTLEKTSVTPNVSSQSVLIFYAPWCGYCKQSMDEFKQAVAQGQGNVVLIDATDTNNSSLVAQYNIKGFPTIIRADGTKYTGSRTADSIVAFMKNES